MSPAAPSARALALASALVAGAAATPARAEGAPAEPRGAVVVALGEDASAAARPLAYDVYRDEALRPLVDDATARVLVGEPPAEGAPRSLADLAEVRRSIAPAVPDAASRRLLASLGGDVRARLVVSVAMVDGKPVARVLRVAGATFEWATLSATPDAAAAWAWPSAVATLRGFVPAPAPLAPVADRPAPAPAPAAPPGKPPFWKSAWFWAPLGVLVTAGVTVLVVSQTTDTQASTIHLQGRVAP